MIIFVKSILLVLNSKNILISLSLACVIISQVFPYTISLYLALILIISIGILHGANDILLIEKTNFISVKDKWLTQLIYFITVLIAVALFYFIPFYALLLFILFSAYHFGEQHWGKKFTSKAFQIHKKVFQFSFGLLILSMLFLLRTKTTNEVIVDLADLYIPKLWYTYLAILSFSTSLVLAIFLTYQKEINLTKMSFEFSLVILYFLIFNFTPLILGFAIYFAFWHSLPSLKDQVDFMYGEKTKKSFTSYLKDAGIYWLISVVGFGLFLYFFYESKLFYSFLFSFIAAITFPHVIVMGKMFSYLKHQKVG